MKLQSLAMPFLRVGNLTFGGGDAITALLQRELVHRRGWLTFDQYGLAQSLARVTPGTAILAFCAATAWMLRRWAGAVADRERRDRPARKHAGPAEAIAPGV
jgi:chromate transporter